MLKMTTYLSAAALMLTGASAHGVIINFGANSTDLAAGEIATDDVVSTNPATYVNPAGGGFDIQIGTTDDNPSSQPTGTLKTNGDAQVTFDFFNTGTTTAVDVFGFLLSVGDIDDSTTIEIDAWDAAGSAIDILPTHLSLGSLLNFDDANDVVSATGSVSGAQFDPTNTFVIDLGNTAASKITFVVNASGSNDGNHFGNGEADFADITIVPEPASLALLGFAGLALIRRR